MKVRALLLTAVLLPGMPTATQDDLEEAALRAALARLEADGGEADDAVVAELVAAGEGAALLALEGFAAASPTGRRARARILAEAAGPTGLPGLLDLFAAPESWDDGVRRSLLLALGRPALGEVDLARRLDLLVDHAAADPDLAVRAVAIETLAATGLSQAVPRLDQLLDVLPPAEQVLAARGLVDLVPGRARLVERVQAELAGPPATPRLGSEALALLCEAYGRALADLPSGGERSAERAPLVLGRRHPAEQVRRAAQQALDELQTRLVALQDFARADAILAALIREGVDPRDLTYRRAQLALAEAGDPAAALVHADTLHADTAGSEEVDERIWSAFALHFRGAARVALGDVAAARGAFEEERAILFGLVAERQDLRPDLRRRPDWPISPFGGSIVVDRIQSLALIELWLAVCCLVEGDEPGDPRVVDHLRAAGEAALRAQLTGIQTDASFGVTSIDDLLDRDLGPRRLLLANARLAGWGEVRGLDAQLRLGRALASVSRRAVPGFVPARLADPRRGDAYLDNGRFVLLQAIQEAEFAAAWRAWWTERREMERRAARLDDPSLADDDARRNNPAYWRVGAATESRRLQEERLRSLTPAERLDPDRRAELFPELARFLPPSTFALTLSGDLRAAGRAAEARDLAARMLEDLRASNTASPTWVEWISARLESAIGAAYMDEDRPVEAEEAYLRADGRLVALENTLQSARDDVEAADDDPQRLASLTGQIEQTQTLRADVLLSLAVNANVRLGDQEKALDYFEAAYDLDQRDFMRVLLACYRARSGREVEARAVLRGLPPDPRLYYNLACTHALLGEPDRALDYLQRDFEENYPSPGGQRRQREWARSDPDLASLRGHPRFERLVGE